MQEHAKRTAIKFFEEQDRLRGGPADDLCADGYTAHLASFPAMDLAGHKEFSAAFYAGFPDLKHQVDEVIAVGDRVAVRFRVIGTNTGSFLGAPASGRPIAIDGLALMTVASGQVTELWGQFDQMGVLQQIGASPDQAETPDSPPVRAARKTTASATLAALSAALLLAACGDSAGKTMSKAEYVARSGATCERTGQKAGEQFTRIVGKAGRPAPEEEQRYLAKAQRFLKEAAIPIIRENIAERRKLPAPEGDEKQIKAILAAGERAVDGFERIAADKSLVRQLFEEKIPDPATEFDALSRRYGINKCGGDQ